MTIEGLSLDKISNLPQPLIEHILTLMPVRDAVRTSTLSTKWRYYWRGMPKLVFTDDMAVAPSPLDCECEYDMPPFGCVCRRQLINAILHVLLVHKGPTRVEFSCTLEGFDSDFDFIIRLLSSMADTVKEFIFLTEDHSYILPRLFYNLHPSFFDLQGLEYIHLEYCDFKIPSAINGFRRLRTMVFYDVTVFAEGFLLFLSKCPLLEKLSLTGFEGNPEPSFQFDAVSLFTLADLLLRVPAIETLTIWDNYMQCLCRRAMPRKLPTSLLHLKQLYLHVRLAIHDVISAALRIIRSSPVLEEITFVMYDGGDDDDDDDDNEEEEDDDDDDGDDDYETTSPIGQASMRLLDPENNSDLKLDHLVFWGIQMFSNTPAEVELVKLIMAKTPVLKTLQIEHNDIFSDDEKLKMHRDFMLFPRASPCAKLIIESKPRVEIFPWDRN